MRLRADPGGMVRRRAGLWGCLALTAAVQGWAQPVTEKTFFEELPVVLSASRIPQSLAATPGAVTVLDRAFIRATGYRDIPSLLKLVPGFQAVSERGGQTHVTYHGFGNAYPNRMQVLIDGRSVYSPSFYGGVDWFLVPVTIDEIERIEVLRGSNSATYGSNAFMGVVNIVTQQAGDHPGSEFSVALGNDVLRDFGARHELRSGDLSLRLNAEVRYDHGHATLVDSPRHGIATLRLDYQLSSQSEISFWAGINDSRRGFGYAGEPANTNGLRAHRAAYSFSHLRWRRALGPAEEFQIGYYRNEERAQEESQVYLPPFFPVVPVDYNRTSVRDNFDFQHLFAPSAQTRLAWGVELRSDRIRSQRFFYVSGTEKQELARLFGNLEWRPHPKLTLNGGAMIERYAGRNAKLAPRLFANWHVVPGHTVRAGSTVAYRAPSLFEERADMRFYSNGYSGTLLQVFWIGQPAIRPERIHANELGYVGQFKTWEAVLDLRMFREKITDFAQDVAVAPPPGVLFARSNSFINSDLPVRFSGFEWHYKARPVNGAQFVAGHASVKARSELGGGSLARQTPKHTTTLTWIQDWSSRWSGTLTAIRYGAYQWGSGSLPVPGYTAFDARLAYRFGTPARPAEVALVLLNQGRRHEQYVFNDNAAIGNPVPRLVLLTARLGI